jgi:hypothetical protein
LRVPTCSDYRCSIDPFYDIDVPADLSRLAKTWLAPKRAAHRQVVAEWARTTAPPPAIGLDL